MAGIKGLIGRVKRLEPKPGKVLRAIGGDLERWEAKIRAGIEAGRYCPRDMPDVLYCIRRWVKAGY